MAFAVPNGTFTFTGLVLNFGPTIGPLAWAENVQKVITPKDAREKIQFFTSSKRGVARISDKK